jgi:hypothetical protein
VAGIVHYVDDESRWKIPKTCCRYCAQALPGELAVTEDD